MGAARPEAAYYPWKALTRGQRRAATGIQNWLHEFSELAIPTRALGKSIFDWQRIDKTRASNVVVIDGPRGAGKTSLMLTLVELWRRALAQEKLDEVLERGEIDLEGFTEPNTSGQVATEPFRKNIIPIRVLDLAPLPQSTSLITWVAAQLREFIDLLDERTAPPFSDVSTHAAVPWEPDWDKELPSRRAWADLTASAAWGWDDNIQARKQMLDPDAYAEELQQSERARVGIVERWRTLIAAIVKDAAERHPNRISKEARIVIPIDDVDMNPLRTRDLLDFVRTFWDPQLVFMLSGDSDLILAALKRYHSKSMGAADESAAGFTLHEMAAQSYDKVVPRAQRFRISPLEPKERVELLREQLPNGLEKLLFRDRWAAEALPPTLRELHDMRQTLSGQKTMSEVVGTLWSTALAREGAPAEVTEQIAQHVDLGQNGMPAIEMDVDAPSERLGEFRIRKDQRSHRAHLVLEVASGLRPLKPENLSVRMRGAMLLAADLAANDPDAAWSQISIAGHGYKFPAVRARILASLASQNDEVNRVRDLLRRGMRWPVPDWPAPVDFARFAEEWRRVIPDILEGRDASRVAVEFLRLVWRVQQEQSLPSPPPPTTPTTLQVPSPQPPIFPPTLADAIIFIQSETDTTMTPRPQAYVEWAETRAPLLATPESGLQWSTAEDLLEILTIGQERIHQARFERARITLETLSKESLPREEVDVALTAIDGAFSDHPWVKRFGAWKQQPAQDKRPQHVRRSFGAQPPKAGRSGPRPRGPRPRVLRK